MAKTMYILKVHFICKQIKLKLVPSRETTHGDVYTRKLGNGISYHSSIDGYGC